MRRRRGGGGGKWCRNVIDFRKTVHEAERGREKHLCKGGRRRWKKRRSGEIGAR
nr:MAG TPA: hypothetical protein [Caudoviricetes sp.]